MVECAWGGSGGGVCLGGSGGGVGLGGGLVAEWAWGGVWWRSGPGGGGSGGGVCLGGGVWWRSGPTLPILRADSSIHAHFQQRGRPAALNCGLHHQVAL